MLEIPSWLTHAFETSFERTDVDVLELYNVEKCFVVRLAEA